MCILTHDIKLVGMVDAAILILHDAGVIALVRRHDGVHYDTPGGITDLRGNMSKSSIESLKKNAGRSHLAVLVPCGTYPPVRAQSTPPVCTARHGLPTPSPFTRWKTHIRQTGCEELWMSACNSKWHSWAGQMCLRHSLKYIGNFLNSAPYPSCSCARMAPR